MSDRGFTPGAYGALEEKYNAVVKQLGDERAAEHMREVKDTAEISALKRQLRDLEYLAKHRTSEELDRLAYDLLELMGRKRRAKKNREIREVLASFGINDQLVLVLLEDA